MISLVYVAAYIEQIQFMACHGITQQDHAAGGTPPHQLDMGNT